MKNNDKLYIYSLGKTNFEINIVVNNIALVLAAQKKYKLFDIKKSTILGYDINISKN